MFFFVVLLCVLLHFCYVFTLPQLSLLFILHLTCLCFLGSLGFRCEHSQGTLPLDSYSGLCPGPFSGSPVHPSFTQVHFHDHTAFLLLPLLCLHLFFYGRLRQKEKTRNSSLTKWCWCGENQNFYVKYNEMVVKGGAREEMLWTDREKSEWKAAGGLL